MQRYSIAIFVRKSVLCSENDCVCVFSFAFGHCGKIIVADRFSVEKGEFLLLEGKRASSKPYSSFGTCFKQVLLHIFKVRHFLQAYTWENNYGHRAK